jgi:methylenetetrahydrofolate dehydrogenase (NADP+) / methenyltetrahydrofolate cyclohydrolase
MTQLPMDRTPGGAVLMDGKRLRDEIVASLRAAIDAAGSPPVCLATVLVGDDKPSRVYINSKQRKAGEAGIISRHTDLPATVSQRELNDTIAGLADDPAVHGILCQFPLPDGLDQSQVLDLIPPLKDVDGLTERSLGRLVQGAPGHVGCTPLGVIRLLERYGVATSGRRAVVIGRSTLTGLPQVLLLGRKGIDATVTLAHSRTSSNDMIDICRAADIIVSCAGQARMITAQHVKPGAAVVDVGISRSEAGIVGDVDFDAVQAVAGAITPMPGGTGPMTIACLLENTLSAARMQGAFPSQPDAVDGVAGAHPLRT